MSWFDAKLWRPTWNFSIKKSYMCNLDNWKKKRQKSFRKNWQQTGTWPSLPKIIKTPFYVTDRKQANECLHLLLCNTKKKLKFRAEHYKSENAYAALSDLMIPEEQADDCWRRPNVGPTPIFWSSTPVAISDLISIRINNYDPFLIYQHWVQASDI